MWPRFRRIGEVDSMTVLGAVLLVLGLLLSIPLLFWIGVVLVVVGLVLLLAGSTGHAIGGRRHYY
jgi:multisubunit Na+/H+ antiporter MnhG subunit